MKPCSREDPAELYQPSPRRLPNKLPELSYPLHDDALTVDSSGHIRLLGRRYFLSQALAAQTVGLREDLNGTWTVTFSALDLGNIHPSDREFVPSSLLHLQT